MGLPFFVDKSNPRDQVAWDLVAPGPTVDVDRSKFQAVVFSLSRLFKVLVAIVH